MASSAPRTTWGAAPVPSGARLKAITAKKRSRNRCGRLLRYPPGAMKAAVMSAPVPVEGHNNHRRSDSEGSSTNCLIIIINSFDCIWICWDECAAVSVSATDLRRPSALRRVRRAWRHAGTAPGQAALAAFSVHLRIVGQWSPTMISHNAVHD